MASSVIVIEFIEESLSDWFLIELAHLLKYSPLPIILTNVRHFYQELQSKFPSLRLHPESFIYLISGRVCMLSQSSPSSLTPSETYDYYVFLSSGSKNLESYLSRFNFDTRSLGSYNMSIDTAVLTTTLIASEGRDLDSISFIDDPEFEVPSSEGVETIEMTGFRYILGSDGRPIISEDLYPLMLRDLIEDMF